MPIEAPYLLFLGDAPDDLAAKTALGIARWRPEACLGQLRLPGCRADAGLPDMSVREAAARGAGALVVGVANAGGVLADWQGNERLKGPQSQVVAASSHELLEETIGFLAEALEEQDADREPSGR